MAICMAGVAMVSLRIAMWTPRTTLPGPGALALKRYRGDRSGMILP